MYWCVSQDQASSPYPGARSNKNTHSDPRNDAAQVGAHGVQTILLNGAILGDNQVGGVTLQNTIATWLIDLFWRKMGSTHK